MDRRWLLPLIGGFGILAMVCIAPPQAQAVVRWEGIVDLDMLHQVQKDLDKAIESDDRLLVVSLASPGGEVLSGLEIAKLVRDAYDKHGLVVEIHANMLCASMCTFILASGTPGHRYIDKEILFLVHSIQSKEHDGDESKCLKYISDPSSQDDKATDRLFDMIRAAYMRYTGKSLAEVTSWTTCGKELIGGGDLAVTLKMADHVE